MDVLFSIKPEFVEKILKGEKKYEYRKTIFKRDDVTKIIIYATKPIGKIIGEFEIEAIISEKPEVLWEKTKNDAGITYNFFHRYFYKKENGYAIKICNVQLYTSPIELSKIVVSGIGPQSFCYLNNFVSPITTPNISSYRVRGAQAWLPFDL